MTEKKAKKPEIPPMLGFHCFELDNLPGSGQSRRAAQLHELPKHVTRLTGKSRLCKIPPMGQRYGDVSRQYRCSCGNVGWSAHVGLGASA